MSTDVVWSVVYMIAILLTGTGWFIYYIMRMAYLETRDGETTVTYPVVGTFSSFSSEPERMVTEDEGLEVRAESYAH